ncbi:Chromosome partition protein Smc [Phycisphaerae bacterium RAS1]|nr:Chromosome partition protein Smc [Phycisphaerae bacterium RAS1]
MTAPADDTPLNPPPASANSARPPGLPPAPASGAPADRIRPIVNEIRERLAEVAQRELALRRREQELERELLAARQSARDAAEQQTRGLQERLEVRSAELDAQTIDLSVRATRLAQHEQRVAARERELADAQKRLDAALDAIRVRSDAIAQQREQDRRNLLHRIGLVRQRETELERRMRLARDQVVRERAALEEQRTALRTEQGELDELRRELESRRAELEQRLSATQSRAGEVERKALELEARRTELEARRFEIQQTVREVEDARQRLASEAQQQSAAADALRRERQSVGRRAEDLAGQQRLVEQKQAELETRAVRHEQRQAQLEQKAAGLHEETQRLEAGFAELEQRRGELEARFQQAEEVAKDAAARHDAAVAVREELDLREAEIRQSGLEVEVGRRELDGGLRQLATAQRDFDERRAAHDAQAARVRELLAEKAGRLAAALRSPLAGPRRWWLRSSLISATAAAAAFAILWASDPPLFEARADVRVALSSRTLQRAAALHAAEIQSAAPELPEDIRSRWTAALAAGRAGVTALPDGAARLTLAQTDGAQAAEIVRAVAQAHVERYGRDAPLLDLPPLYVELAARRAPARQEHAVLSARQSELREMIGSLPAAEDHRQAADRLEEAGAQRVALAEQIAALDARLAALLDAPPPSGTIDERQLEQRVTADEQLREDEREFRAAALEYRAEFTVALTRLKEPAAKVQKDLASAGAVVREQRGSQPPVPVAEALERLQTDIDKLTTLVASGDAELLKTQRLVEQMDVVQGVAELLTLQKSAADSAAATAAELERALREMERRVEGLRGATDGGAREVVIAAVLRGEMNNLVSSAAGLILAARGVGLSENFRLDALDRQIRGLRGRIQQRNEQLRQQMQAEADRAARDALAREAAAVRQDAQAAQQRRDELLTSLVGQLSRMRELDQAAAQRARLEAELADNEARFKRLTSELQRIDADLVTAEARRSGEPPDELFAEAPRVVQIGGVHRVRNATLGAAATFAATFAMLVLMLVRLPGGGRDEAQRALTNLLHDDARPP